VISLPTKEAQIIQTHATLIHIVVKAVHNHELMPELERALEVIRQNGWTDLVAVIRKIIGGGRDLSLATNLDEADRVIVKAILLGLQNPETLPKPLQQADPVFAAPGLANMIHQTRTGNAESLQSLAHLSEKMIKVGGDMGRLGGIMRRLVNGERDVDRLCKGMSAQGRSLVISILEELAKLQTH
jgi:hypothetical protein